MDRKSIIIIVVSFILLMAWYPLFVNKLYPPKPVAPGTTNLTTTVSNAAPTNAALPSPAPRTPLTPEAIEPPSLTQLAPGTNAPEELLEVTNSNAHYTFTSFGGGLRLV